MNIHITIKAAIIPALGKQHSSQRPDYLESLYEYGSPHGARRRYEVLGRSSSAAVWKARPRTRRRVSLGAWWH